VSRDQIKNLTHVHCLSTEESRLECQCTS